MEGGKASPYSLNLRGQIVETGSKKPHRSNQILREIFRKAVFQVPGKGPGVIKNRLRRSITGVI